MKVLFPFVGDSVGGSHLSTLELCHILKRSNIEIIILLHDNQGPLAKLLKEKKINFIELRTPFLAGGSSNIAMILFRMMWNILPLSKFINKNNIDIVHGNDLRVNLTWSLATKMSRAKFIWHQRTILSKSYLWNSVVYLCSHFIATSQAVMNSAPDNIPNPKKSLVYNAFDGETKFKKNNSRDLINRKFPECEDTLLLGYVGRLVSYKNVDFLIKCLPEVISISKKPLHLLIIGIGSKDYLGYLRGIVSELNLESNISFTGFVNNPSEIISGLDILVASSGIDAFGRTIIESMLQLTPVLAANKGGHLEIVEDEYDGLLYKVNNDDNYVKNVIRLIENESLREKLARRALLKCGTKFTQNNHFLSIKKIYKSVIRNEKFNY